MLKILLWIWAFKASQVALVVKNLPANAGDVKWYGFDPSIRKIPWRRAWQLTPVFLPGESRGQRSLAGCSYRVTDSWTQLKELRTHTWEFKMCSMASLVAQRLKRLPIVQETRVWFLGWEDPLEKGMTTHFSILAWRIPWTEEPGGL